MSELVNEMKMVIDMNIPENKDELVWIINNLGKLIFNDNVWEQNNVYKNENQKYPETLDGLLKIIDNIITDNNDKSTLIKYLFGKSLNKLNTSSQVNK